MSVPIELPISLSDLEMWDARIRPTFSGASLVLFDPERRNSAG